LVTNGHRATCPIDRAEDGRKDRGVTGADDTGKPDELARVHVDIERFDPNRGQIANTKYWFGANRAPNRRRDSADPLQFIADEQLHQL
jgi:hypothetical protein